METTETGLTEQPHYEPGMILGKEAQYYLQQAGKWAKFLGIVGFVLCALFFLMAIFIGSIFAFIAKLSPGVPPNPALSAVGPALSFIYILMDAVYFTVVLYLYQFGTRAVNGIAFNDSAIVAGALSKLKSFFKAWAIITIVLLSLYTLIIIVVVAAGTGLASMMH